MNKPFLLKPFGQSYLWGGSKLNETYHRDVAIEPFAESWECSTHPDGPSTVVTGEHQGKTLRDVLLMHPEYLGSHVNDKAVLPILVKLIDAKEDLSIQVHPNDHYAYENEDGQLGKSEFWYVLEAEEDARLIYGFHHPTTRQQVEEALLNHTLDNHLQAVPVSAGDAFFIEAGTVHAIGKGIVLVEVQESSNLTYRLYDYGRLDKNGKERELHIAKALDVMHYGVSRIQKNELRTLRYKPGYASELLCRCKYFQVERVLIHTKHAKNPPMIQRNDVSFQICMNIKGDITIDGIKMQVGDCLFVPISCDDLKVEGKGELLVIQC